MAGGRRGRPSAMRRTRPSESEPSKPPTNSQEPVLSLSSNAASIQDHMATIDSTNKENEIPGDASGVSAQGRPKRRLVPTPHADRALLEAMRPGRVQKTGSDSLGSGDASSATNSANYSDAGDEDTLEDVQRQQGVWSGDSDDDYEEPLARRLTKRLAGQQRLSDATSASQASSQNSTDHTSSGGDMSATFITSAQATLPASSSTVGSSPHTGRLHQLRGAISHSLPTLPMNTEPYSAPSGFGPSATHSVPARLMPFQSTPFQSTSTLPAPSPDLPALMSLAPSPNPHIPSQDLASPSGHKHTRPVEADEDESPEDRKRRKKAEANSNRQRYKHYNNSMELKRVLQLTGDLLKIAWMRSNAYPSSDEEDAAIKSKFAAALEQRGHPEDWYRLSDKDVKLLEQEDSNIRSRIRAAAAAIVPQHYNLNPAPENDEERAHNSRVVARALDGARFTYADPDRMEGRFQSDLITQVIQRAFFAVPSSVGCIYHDELDPMPSPLIALAATAIHHVLTWYKDGDCHSTAFTGQRWAQYDSFVESVQQFERGKLAQLWRIHRERVLSRCLFVAGAIKEVIREEPIKPLPEDELEREQRRLEALYASDISASDHEGVPARATEHADDRLNLAFSPVDDPLSADIADHTVRETSTP